MLRCYVAGEGYEWEAICTDLDISVNGCSQDEARQRLEGAVRSYILDACAEAPDQRDRLLRRRSPLWVSLGWRLNVALSALLSRRNDRQLAAFGTPCPG